MDLINQIWHQVMHTRALPEALWNQLAGLPQGHRADTNGRYAKNARLLAAGVEVLFEFTPHQTSEDDEHSPLFTFSLFPERNAIWFAYGDAYYGGYANPTVDGFIEASGISISGTAYKELQPKTLLETLDLVTEHDPEIANLFRQDPSKADALRKRVADVSAALHQAA
ncbi:hypothetical protein [Ferrimonas marina]|uniref:Uncharacterized protein n=1 Tax=Ferrimonas marina TaxID=299255 RepID=A0A1M5TPM7_9GAMM|nr:hypothetical protein [Ferrimonas marina]SHH52353.1 hypothetical protein SAMN02745129_2218 [Ferrimonas marina]